MMPKTTQHTQYTQGPLLEKARQILAQEQAQDPRFYQRSELTRHALADLEGCPIELIDLNTSLPSIWHGGLARPLPGVDIWHLDTFDSTSFYSTDVRVMDWNPISDLPTIVLDQAF